MKLFTMMKVAEIVELTTIIADNRWIKKEEYIKSIQQEEPTEGYTAWMHLESLELAFRESKKRSKAKVVEIMKKINRGVSLEKFNGEEERTYHNRCTHDYSDNYSQIDYGCGGYMGNGK